MDDSIRRRMRAVRTLMGSPNRGEAEAASARYSEMLAKYGDPEERPMVAVDHWPFGEGGRGFRVVMTEELLRTVGPAAMAELIRRSQAARRAAAAAGFRNPRPAKPEPAPAPADEATQKRREAEARVAAMFGEVLARNGGLRFDVAYRRPPTNPAGS